MIFLLKFIHFKHNNLFNTAEQYSMNKIINRNVYIYGPYAYINYYKQSMKVETLPEKIYFVYIFLNCNNIFVNVLYYSLNKV